MNQIKKSINILPFSPSLQLLLVSLWLPGFLSCLSPAHWPVVHSVLAALFPYSATNNSNVLHISHCYYHLVLTYNSLQPIFHQINQYMINSIHPIWTCCFNEVFQFVFIKLCVKTANTQVPILEGD